MPKSTGPSVLAGFLEIVQQESTKVGSKCHTGIILSLLEDADKTVFQDALNNLKFTATAIANAMNKNGLSKKYLGQDLGESSVQRHRRGVCHCKQGSR